MSTSPGTAHTDPADLDRWFAALDHLRVGVGDQSWTIEVVGIHPAGPDLWVQIVAIDRPGWSGVLRLNSTTRLDAAATALGEQPGPPTNGIRVIDLTKGTSDER